MATLVIDRFEGELAVLEQDGRTFELPRAWLPPEAAEGEVLRLSVYTNARSPALSFLRFMRDQGETRARREEAAALRAALPKGPEGDVEL